MGHFESESFSEVTYFFRDLFQNDLFQEVIHLRNDYQLKIYFQIRIEDLETSAEKLKGEINSLSASKSELEEEKETVEKEKAALTEENSSLRKQLAEKTDQIEKYEINQQKLQGQHLTLSPNLHTYLLTLTLASGLCEDYKP